METLPASKKCSRVYLRINGEAIEPINALHYLGHTITYNNSDWEAVYRNLQKAWRYQGMISKMLTKTVATVQSLGMLYKAVSHTLILFWGESWVVTVAMLKLLEKFHHGFYIAGITAQRAEDRYLEYPVVADEMEAAGLCTIK